MNAIVSVYNKEKLDVLGEILKKKGFNIFASKGTLKYLFDIGINAIPVETIACNPTGYDNYVSSLGFNSLMGVLDDGNMPIDILRVPIDVVVYNFVPSWDIIMDKQGFNIQNVDLGGPTMVRAAAINYKKVIIITSPEQYNLLESYDTIDDKERIMLAKKAFDYCSEYDRKLSHYLQLLMEK